MEQTKDLSLVSMNFEQIAPFKESKGLEIQARSETDAIGLCGSLCGHFVALFL